MWAVVLVVSLCCLCGVVRGDGLAVIQPSGTVKCGSAVTIQFYATSNGVVSGSDKVRMTLFTQTSTPVLRRTTLVAVLGEVPHDAGTFTFQIASPIDPLWLPHLQKLTDGKIYRVFVRAEKVGDSDVSSEPGFFDSQADFLIECCLPGQTQCECRSSLPTCSVSTDFCLMGRCASGAAPEGALNGKCRTAAPRCDDGAVCALSSSTCVADNLSCPRGSEGCQCKDANACNNPSLRCFNQKCEAFAPTTADLLGAACSTADQSACFTALKDPLSCLDGKCAACSPGATYCTCRPGDLCDGGVPCEYGRCGGLGVSKGCFNCPCIDGVRCNGGPSYLVCRFGRCELPKVGNPVCQGGGVGCECVTSATGRKGCTQGGLVCEADNICRPGNVVATIATPAPDTEPATEKATTAGAASLAVALLAPALLVPFV